MRRGLDPDRRRKVAGAQRYHLTLVGEVELSAGYHRLGCRQIGQGFHYYHLQGVGR